MEVREKERGRPRHPPGPPHSPPSYAGYKLPEMQPLETYEAVAFAAPAWALLKALGDPKAAQYENDVRRLRSMGGLARGYYGDSTALLAGLQLTKPAWKK